MLNQSCDDKFMEILERIDPKLKFYARHLSWTSKIVESDDLYQEALLKILERSRVEPEFLNQNDSYVACFGLWMMKNFVKHQRNLYYKKITEERLDIAEPEDRLQVGHFPKPESEAVKAEVNDLVENLPFGYRNLFKKIVDGFSWDEVARQLKISRGSYFWRRETMVHRLNKAWLAPSDQKNAILQNIGRRSLV